MNTKHRNMRITGAIVYLPKLRYLYQIFFFQRKEKGTQNHSSCVYLTEWWLGLFFSPQKARLERKLPYVYIFPWVNLCAHTQINMPMYIYISLKREFNVVTCSSFSDTYKCRMLLQFCVCYCYGSSLTKISTGACVWVHSLQLVALFWKATEPLGPWQRGDQQM